METQRVNASLIKVVIVAVLFGAVGTFLGSWAWQAFSEHRKAEVAAAVKALEEAERKSPRGKQREAVRALLNDPGSAEFRNERAAGADGKVWCGEVNAKNRMGAFVGFTRYMVLMYDADRPIAEIEPAVTPTDRVDAAMRAYFADAWKIACSEAGKK